MDDLKVADALNLFYGDENISDEAFVKKINFIKVGFLQIPFPNLKQRRARMKNACHAQFTKEEI